MPESNTLTIAPTLHRKVLKLMGNRFEITVVSENKDEAFSRIDDAVAEISRIEKLLTTFSENSQTNLINRNAGISPVKVDKEVFDIIARSKRISDVTQGAFDITYGSVDKKLWNFDKTMTSLPDVETAKRSVHLINYRNVILDEKKCTVFLKEKGMRIGFGGIGKGYAAERANGKEWTIGIADPNSAHHPFSYLNITNMAIATSGNYEKYITIKGKRYSHTIDPKTGLPVSGIKSVTIISPNAEIADAMATPVMIMGIKVGLDMVNQVRGLACIIVDDNDKIYTSKNINLK